MQNTTAFEKMELDGWRDPSIAKGYADGFSVATKHVARKLSDEVFADQGSVVLDLCTGHGVVASELLKRGAKVIGLDFSKTMIELARSAAPAAQFVQGDAMAMEFADASFDAVVIGFGIPHFPDPSHGLSEAARVIKREGRIAFSIWKGKGTDGSFGWLYDAVERLGDPSVTLPEGPDAHLLADWETAKSITTDAGFEDVRYTELQTEIFVPNPEALFDVFDRGAVRAAALLGSQPLETRKAIRADLARRVETAGFQSGGGYTVPAPSVVISGARS